MNFTQARLTNIHQTQAASREPGDFRFEADEDLGLQKVQHFRLSCDANISLVKKFKFALGGGDKKLEDLISRLREHNEVLRYYGPPVEVMRLDKGVYDRIGAVVTEQLQFLLRGFEQEAQNATNPVLVRRYQALAKLAKFRARVREVTESPTLPVFQISSFVVKANYAVDPRGVSTMALLYDYPQPGDRRVVLVEWVQSPRLPGKVKEAEKLAMLLSTPKPDEMLVPDCYGVLDDISQSNRLGIVLMPPRNIRMSSPVTLTPGAISERRMPISLRSLITEPWRSLQVPTLGTKFNIAKKIVDTLHIMHAAEWVHK